MTARHIASVVAYIAVLSPLSQHALTALPEGEPLRENGLRQALLGESSRNAGESGIWRADIIRPKIIDKR